jgi:hypothetical protein
MLTLSAQFQLNLPVQRQGRREYPRAISLSTTDSRLHLLKRTKFVATIVSSDLGSNTIRHVMASTIALSHFTSGKSFATSAATSSHMTMPFRCALLFVTTVNSFLGLFCAISNANRISRSTQCRVKIETSVAISHGRPRWDLPPWPAYSPSEFSRTITQSRSPSFTLRSGEVVPRKILVGRTLAYC